MEQICLIGGLATIVGVTLASNYSNRFFSKSNKKTSDSNNNELSSLKKETRASSPFGLTYEQIFNLLAICLLLVLPVFTYIKTISTSSLHQFVYATFCLILFGNFFKMIKSYAQYTNVYREEFFRHRIKSVAQMFSTGLLCIAVKVNINFFYSLAKQKHKKWLNSIKTIFIYEMTQLLIVQHYVTKVGWYLSMTCNPLNRKRK